MEARCRVAAGSAVKFAPIHPVTQHGAGKGGGVGKWLPRVEGCGAGVSPSAAGSALVSATMGGQAGGAPGIQPESAVPAAYASLVRKVQGRETCPPGAVCARVGRCCAVCTVSQWSSMA